MERRKPSVTRRGFLRGGATVTAALATGLAGRAQSDEAAGDAVPGGDGGIPAYDEVPVHFEVNGEAVGAKAGVDSSALEVLRDGLGLTGTKEGCGHGACGACTVLLDGEAVASCLLPATALEGRALTTVEGLGEELHPVQRAFLAEDALQCGFCTPGFVMKSVDFYERWREEHGDEEPTRGEVAAALSSNLCRCGAYEAIYRAVQGACAGRFEQGPVSGPRKDGPEKVRGAALYTVDVQLEGMLHGAMLRSPHAHARVAAVDTAAALGVPGVEAAVLLTEVGSLIRYPGQEVLALAARDPEAARRGLEAAQVTYEVLPASVTVGAALSEDAALVYGKGVGRVASSTEGPVPRLPWDGNLRGPSSLFGTKAGAAKEAVHAAREAGSSLLFEGRFTAQAQCHTALEPHATVARWEEGGDLTIWMSTQGARDMADDIAQRWGLRRDRVKLYAHYIGGGFGAKCRVGMDTVAAVELARSTGRPVRVAHDRRGELIAGGSRPSAETEVALLSTAEGGLAAMDVQSWSNSGTAVGHNVGIFFRVMYPGAPKSLDDFDVTTHSPPAEPFRGPGGPAAYWALEQTVDSLAHARGEDPIQLRKRWDPNPARQELYDVASSLPLWAERSPVGADTGRFRRGVGVASASWFYFVQPDVRVELVAQDGAFTVRCGVQDMGNGARSSLAWAVGEVLGLPPEAIQVEIGESDLPHGPLSAGSRTTASMVPAAQQAARMLARELAFRHGVRVGMAGVQSGDGLGGVRHGQEVVPWSEVLEGMGPVQVEGRRDADPGGWFFPIRIADIVIGRHLAASVTVVEVEVDARLGKVRTTRAWSGIGAGRIVVPALARSQAEGGLLQGVGYALYEERRADPHTGRLLTHDLEKYRMARIGDSPEIDVHFAQAGFEGVVGGGIGIGEICTVGVAAAVGNAVHAATGWRCRDLPIRPDRVLEGLKG